MLCRLGLLKFMLFLLDFWDGIDLIGGGGVLGSCVRLMNYFVVFFNALARDFGANHARNFRRAESLTLVSIEQGLAPVTQPSNLSTYGTHFIFVIDL